MTKNSKRVLLIIDVQYGFLDGGELGVNGSIDKMDAIAKYIKECDVCYDNCSGDMNTKIVQLVEF